MKATAGQLFAANDSFERELLPSTKPPLGSAEEATDADTAVFKKKGEQAAAAALAE